MGKQARTKQKHRRQEQKRSRLRSRAVATFNGVTIDANAALAAVYETAAPADRRALEARVAELADAVQSDPKRVAVAVELARRITAAPIGRGGMPGSPTEDGELPNLRRRVKAALDAVRADVPDACPHLTPETLAAGLCVDEPGLVMCSDCQNEHAASGHPPQWNHTCLECGHVDMRGISPVMSVPIVGLPVRFGGEVHLFLSPVVLTGLGVCNPCRLATGRKRKLAGGVR